MIKKLKSLFTVGFIVILTLGLIACSSEGGKDSKADADSSGYPKKPIEIVVPAGAGGDTDRNTRIVANYLSEELGEDLVITNVVGGGGSVGTGEVLQSDPDGYKAVAFHNSMIINSILDLADFSYEDFQLAGTAVGDLGNSFIVNAESEITDLQTLVELAKEKPGEITIATETGGFTHLQLIAFQEVTGTELKVVDVGTAADKTKALLAGQIDIIPTQLGLVQSYIDSGDFKSLGVMSEERLENAPDVPTFIEEGVDISFDKLFFWAFPKDTPQEIIDKFSSALEAVANNSDFQEEIKPHIIDPLYLDPNELEEHLEQLTEEYTKLQESAE